MEQKSKFTSFLGTSPTTKLLDFLITGRDFDYSLTDIATNSGVGWATLYRIFPKFIENQIVIRTRTIGNAKLFQLNSKNETVQKLVTLYKSILKMEQEILIEN